MMSCVSLRSPFCQMYPPFLHSRKNEKLATPASLRRATPASNLGPSSTRTDFTPSHLIPYFT